MPLQGAEVAVAEVLDDGAFVVEFGVLEEEVVVAPLGEPVAGGGPDGWAGAVQLAAAFAVEV